MEPAATTPIVTTGTLLVVDDNRTWYAPGSPAHEQLEQNYADVLARSDVVLANCDPVADSMRAPVLSDGVAAISIACMMLGTPAITITLPSLKPGAFEIALSTRSAPVGMRAIRSRAGVSGSPAAW